MRQEIPFSADCDFCDEFSGGNDNAFVSLYGEELEGRSLASTDNFHALPSLGQITEGHLMIVPTAHYTAIGDLPLPMIDELEHLATIVRKALTQIYGKSIFFEHGTRSNGAGGCGIVHAHLHAVPLGTGSDPISELAKLQRFFRVNSFVDLSRATSGKSYLYYESANSERHVSCPDHLPSQYMRRFLSEFIGKSQWDWRNAGKESAFRCTVSKMSAWQTQHCAELTPR